VITQLVKSRETSKPKSKNSFRRFTTLGLCGYVSTEMALTYTYVSHEQIHLQYVDSLHGGYLLLHSYYLIYTISLKIYSSCFHFQCHYLFLLMLLALFFFTYLSSLCSVPFSRDTFLQRLMKTSLQYTP